MTGLEAAYQVVAEDVERTLTARWEDWPGTGGPEVVGSPGRMPRCTMDV